MQTESLPRPSDRWIPWMIIAFFIALISVLVPMGIIAVTTNTGVVTEHAYEKGLAYNKAIQADAEQQALNWQGDLTLHPDATTHNIAVDFRLTDKTGKALDKASVVLWLVRPSAGGMDTKTDLQLASDGHYRVTVAPAMPGLWEARISATQDGHNYQMIKRVSVP